MAASYLYESNQNSIQIFCFDLCLGSYRGSISAPGIFFLPFPTHACFCPPPPPHQTIWSTFLPCLRIWPVLCTQFMMLARVVVRSGGNDIFVLLNSYFGLCNVLCTEGLWSSAVSLGDFPK